MAKFEPIGRLQGLLGEWSHAEAVAAADRTLRQLKDWKIPVKPGNRLALSKRAMERIERFDVQFGYGDRETERLWAEASRTIFELHFIVQGLDPRQPETRRKLQEVIGGPLEPRQHDPARDIQAEFFMAALFNRAGYHVEWGEPDLIISDKRGKLGVAVKRVTSTDERKYHRRVRKAHKQLNGAGLEGFVAVYADQLLARAIGKKADIGEWLYQKVQKWLEFIPLDSPDCTVVGLMGVALSFQHIPGTARTMAASLRFAPVFVSSADHQMQVQVIRYAERMANNVAEGLKQVIAERE